MLITIHPHLEDDWLEACSGLNDASHDDDVAVIFDDSDGVDTVACPVTLPSSLDSPSADATDHMFYAVDVCNRFSSLSVENIPVMESCQASNSTSIIATSGNIADDMSSSSSSTSLNTSSTTMDTLPDFLNWPVEENQKMSFRAAKRQRRTQCKQVNSQTMVEVESDSSNRQLDLSSTTIQEENKKSKLTKKPRQLSDNTATENQQQKEEIELDSSDDEVKKGRSQGGLGLSSDDLDLAAEMMIHCSSNQEFKLATSGNKFDKQQEGSPGGKQIINDVQFNSSIVPPPTTVPVVWQKINPSIKLLLSKKYSNHSRQLCRSHDHLVPHLQLSLMTSMPSWLALNGNNLRRHHNSRPKILT